MPSKSKRQNLTPAEVTALCDAADAASRAKPRSRNVTFSWRGRHFKIRLTNLAMYVELLDGTPVAMRYH